MIFMRAFCNTRGDFRMETTESHVHFWVPLASFFYISSMAVLALSVSPLFHPSLLLLIPSLVVSLLLSC